MLEDATVLALVVFSRAGYSEKGYQPGRGWLAIPCGEISAGMMRNLTSPAI